MYIETLKNPATKQGSSKLHAIKQQAMCCNFLPLLKYCANQIPALSYSALTR